MTIPRRKSIYKPRVNFSLRKEVFFIALGSIIGGFTMKVPDFFSDLIIGSDYYLFWLAAASIANSNQYVVGIILHSVVATIIGIVTGIILNLSQN